MKLKSIASKVAAASALALTALLVAPAAANAVPFGNTVAVSVDASTRCIAGGVHEVVVLQNLGKDPIAISTSSHVEKNLTVAPGKTTSYVVNLRTKNFSGDELQFGLKSTNGSQGALVVQSPSRSC